jgi:hypothetical protein
MLTLIIKKKHSQEVREQLGFDILEIIKNDENIFIFYMEL